MPFPCPRWSLKLRVASLVPPAGPGPPMPQLLLGPSALGWVRLRDGG